MEYLLTWRFNLRSNNAFLIAINSLMECSFSDAIHDPSVCVTRSAISTSQGRLRLSSKAASVGLFLLNVSDTQKYSITVDISVDIRVVGHSIFGTMLVYPSYFRKKYKEEYNNNNKVITAKIDVYERWCTFILIVSDLTQPSTFLFFSFILVLDQH